MQETSATFTFPSFHLVLRPARLKSLLLVLIALCLVGCGKAKDTPVVVTVFAAASAGPLMEALGAAYHQKHPTDFRFSFAASSTLARQIEVGAEPDLFLSANNEWPALLEKRGLLDQTHPFLRNTLVLASPKNRTFPISFSPEYRLDLAFDGKLVMGDPRHVPAGIYARQALKHLGWWDRIEGRVLAAADVREALRLLELGEADAGLLYATDASASERVSVLGVFAAESHDPIQYPVGLLAGASSEAKAFYNFMFTEEAREIVIAHGFQPESVRSLEGGHAD